MDDGVEAFGASTLQSAQFAPASLHFLHGQPNILTSVEIPTTRYTIASTVGIDPKIKLTRLIDEPISIPAPTRPQLRPPTSTNTQAIFAATHLP